MTDVDVDILFLVHDRAHYIRRTLPRLLASVPDGSRIWIWQNEDHREVSRLLDEHLDDPRVFRVHRHPTNAGVTAPTNWLWREAAGALVGKVDDDCLVPDGWVEALVAAHEGSRALGVIGMWPFPEGDLLPETLRHRSVALGEQRHLLRNCWVGGSGYLMKRECVGMNGLVSQRRSFTRYCIDLSAFGYLVGWHYPLILQDHMEDPRSPYCTIRTDSDLVEQRPQAIRLLPEPTVQAWVRQHEELARRVQTASLDPKEHQSLRHRSSWLLRYLTVR
jgi:hypothetical protein